jgi:hypothetical protein
MNKKTSSLRFRCGGLRQRPKPQKRPSCWSASIYSTPHGKRRAQRSSCLTDIWNERALTEKSSAGCFAI